MQRSNPEDYLRSLRHADFRRRADFAPQEVYRHQSRGWEYIPVHPFGDETELLRRLGLSPNNCDHADAWWAIDGDATLLEATIVCTAGGQAGLFAKPTQHEEQWVYLVATLDAPFITRSVFEEAMVRFADAGFPRGQRFQLRWGDQWLDVTADRNIA